MMRFLLFNAVVGVALVYLVSGGTLPTAESFRDGVNAAQATAEMAAARVKRQLHVDDASPANTPRTPLKPVQTAAETKPAPNGYAKDVIPESKPAAPAPKPAPAPPKRTETPPPPPPVPAPQTTQPAVGPLPLPKAQSVAARVEHKIDEAKALNTAQGRRRAEVLAEGPVVPAPSGGGVALKEGTRLMSAGERRRQLDSLAEEMEMLYLEKVGG